MRVFLAIILSLVLSYPIAAQSAGHSAVAKIFGTDEDCKRTITNNPGDELVITFFPGTDDATEHYEHPEDPESMQLVTSDGAILVNILATSGGYTKPYTYPSIG